MQAGTPDGGGWLRSGEMCEPGVSGTYKVVISKIGIRFTKVDDACERRSRIDGETWYRR